MAFPSAAAEDAAGNPNDTSVATLRRRTPSAEGLPPENFKYFWLDFELTLQPNGQVVNQVGDLPPAFQIQPPFTLRTASQYFPNLRNRWGNEYNVSVVKNTMVTEGKIIQFRAECFNLFNHPIFPGDPVIDSSSPNFGKLLRDNGQTNVPRQIQLAVRFTF